DRAVGQKSTAFDESGGPAKVRGSLRGCYPHRPDRLRPALAHDRKQQRSGLPFDCSFDVGGIASHSPDTTATAFILACFAVWGAISRSGPFAQDNLNDSFLLLLAFMISVSIPSLALSARVAAQERHERHIEALMLELSHRSKNLLAVVQ